MPPPVLVRFGRRLVLFDAAGAARRLTLGEGPEEAAELILGEGGPPPSLRDLVAPSAPGGPPAVDDRRLQRLLAPAVGPLRSPDLQTRRAAREGAFAGAPADRRFLLLLARRSIERALASPEEALISLVREEERLERTVHREEGASHHFVAGGHPTAEGYAKDWAVFREALERHHARLRSAVEAEAGHAAPNLSALLGARTAGRLIAAAGGLLPLSRMSAPRLQLLGARRRPAAGHTPRYGQIFRASRMDDVPPSGRGAYARSLAALAVIAARADATTRADIASGLTAKRDRRVEQLRRQRA